MAALNYSINLLDQSNSGIGPYTLVVLKNPTAASGGTDITANGGPSSNVGGSTNTLGVLNPQELMGYAAHVVGDNIATALQSDTLN